MIQMTTKRSFKAQTGINLQMRNDDQIDYTIEIFACREGRKIREPPFIIISHMHATIEHYISTGNCYNNTTPSDIFYYNEKEF